RYAPEITVPGASPPCAAMWSMLRLVEVDSRAATVRTFALRDAFHATWQRRRVEAATGEVRPSPGGGLVIVSFEPSRAPSRVPSRARRHRHRVDAERAL